MIEIATGQYPFPNARNLFEQLKGICQDEPPKLPPGKFSNNFEDFISKWYVNYIRWDFYLR